MTETPDSVYAWSVETFGPVTDLFSTISRSYQEYAELLDILGDKPASAGHTTTLDGAFAATEGSAARRRMIAHEAADVAQILFRAAGAAGIASTWDGAVFHNCRSSVVLAAINRNMSDLMTHWAHEPAPRPLGNHKRMGLEDALFYVLSGLDFIAFKEAETTLNEAVQSKMAINRKRTFVGDRHVEEAPAELTEKSAGVSCGVVGAADFVVTMAAQIIALPSAAECPKFVDLGDRMLTVTAKVDPSSLPSVVVDLGGSNAVAAPADPFAPIDLEFDGPVSITRRTVYPGYFPWQMPKVAPLTVRGETSSPWALRSDEIAQL